MKVVFNSVLSLVERHICQFFFHFTTLVTEKKNVSNCYSIVHKESFIGKCKSEGGSNSNNSRKACASPDQR